MMRSRLEFLKRKNIGIKRQNSYEKVFLESGFNKNDLTFCPLSETDKVIEKVVFTFSEIDPKITLCKWDNSEKPDLFLEIVNRIDKDSECYLFTDDYHYCGMFLVNTRKAFNCVMEIAKNDYQNTCFLLDVNLKFSFTVNYYDDEHPDFPGFFDIQRKLKL